MQLCVRSHAIVFDFTQNLCKIVDRHIFRVYNINEKCFNKYFYLMAMEKKDKLYIGLYNDYYGALLTDYQRELVDMYYNRDMSLGEIADIHSISPQGVSDTLKRAERTLIEAERKLKVVERSDKLRALLDEMESVGGERVAHIVKKARDLLDN